MNQNRKLKLAVQLLSHGQVTEAAKVSERLLADAPEDAGVIYIACEVAMAQNRLGAALEYIDRAIECEPAKPEFRLRKAGIQVIARRGLEAQATASELAALQPDNADMQLAAARVFIDCGNHAGAEALLERAATLGGNKPDILSKYATNQFFLGKTDAAEQAISDYLALEPAAIGRKILLRSVLKRQTPESNHVDELRAYLEKPLPREEAVNGYFALARELEDLGSYEEAFKMLQSGAALQKQIGLYNSESELQNIHDLMQTFQAENFASIPDSDAQDSPVFIVGLPRTGTTLVERLITRQGGVRSAEETYDFTFAFSSVIEEFIAAHPERGLTPLTAALEVDYKEIGRRYLDNMRGMLGEADIYLDKTPFNFLYCGLIRKAFPNARIVHLVRDPMDACYAVFKTLFARAYFYSYDLDDLADYYVVYREMMDHWNHLMPGAILNVEYEALVSDPLNVSRQITDFVGIPWSEDIIEVQDSAVACSTASAAQVREPIYTRSIGLWRNVAAGMEPVRQKLAAANLVDENGNPLTAQQPG